MSASNASAGKYTHIWQKYRPVLLNLMVASSSKGPQTYDLSSHEFIDVNNKKTTGYSFALKIFQNRNNSEKKVNVAGLDLLAVLQQSQKSQQLTQEAAYRFEMDKNFKIQVSCEPVETATEETSEEPEEA
ncbi:MAG: hypothetical protein R8G66_05330 [Cytophagales bacterium]|nr:hypothetical protein [Cytophagales bacterium]